MRGDEGYSLIDTLLAITVTMIVLATALRLLTFASGAASRAVVRNELMECARTAATVMSRNIQRSSEFKLTLVGNNTLRRLELIQPEVKPGKPGTYIFEYNPTVSKLDANYHRLIFTGDRGIEGNSGSNELASNLADVRILINGQDTMFIEIKTDNTITVNSDKKVAGKNEIITVEPVFIRIPVSIIGKTRLP